MKAPRTALLHCLTRPIRTLKGLLLILLLLSQGPLVAQQGWPAELQAGPDRILVYEPQPESLDGNHAELRSAVSIRTGESRDPVFGTVWAEATLEVDRTNRLGKITKVSVTDLRMPDLDERHDAAIRQAISEKLPQQAPLISLDHLVAALERENTGTGDYSNAPPEIIYQERPGVLVFIDGEPRYEQIDRDPSQYDDPNHLAPPGKVERVVNTPFIMLRWNGGRHYLYGSDMWFSTDELSGRWTRDYSVPSKVRDIVEQVDEGAALATTDRDGAAVAPEIVVRTTPAVLVDLDGAPQWRAVAGTGLLYAENSTKDLFMNGADQHYYVLASGRWFATPDLHAGPWRYVPADGLPADFARIPEGSVKDGTLAHIAGTRAAKEAVRDAQVPQTARVDRRSAQLEVTYDGDPWFDPVPGTAVELAINASVTVLRINGHYHALDNAVWYDAPTPQGPWQVSTAVPAEVNSIPPSSPAYNTRYVYIYDHTPDVVYVGYTAGYLGGFIQNGALIYGTGFYYTPWPGFWRPRPFTWGFHMYYDPWIGWGPAWGWGWNWYYPLWYGWGWGPYRPWGWGWGWCGPYGYYPAHVHANNSFYGPRRSINSAHGAGSGRSMGQDLRSEPRDLYEGRAGRGITPTRLMRNDDPAVTGARTEQGRSNAARQDYFSDRDGNVYRRFGDRTERLENGRWQRERPVSTRPKVATETDGQDRRPSSPTNPPVRNTPGRATPPPADIRMDRERGRQREQGYQQYRQRPTSPQRPGRAVPSAPTPRANPAPPPSRGGGMAPARGGGGGSAPSRSGGRR